MKYLKFLNNPIVYYKTRYDIEEDFDFVDVFDPNGDYILNKHFYDYGRGYKEYILKKINLEKKTKVIISSVKGIITESKMKFEKIDYVIAYEIYDEDEMLELEPYCRCSQCKKNLCWKFFDENNCLTKGYRHPRIVKMARDFKKNSKKTKKCIIQ